MKGSEPASESVSESEPEVEIGIGCGGGSRVGSGLCATNLRFLCLPALLSLLPISSAVATDAALELRLMTFNIRYGTADDGQDRWTQRRAQVFDFLRGQAADVVGLQEALRFQIDELLAALPEYAAVGVGRDDGAAKGEHSSILYSAARFALESSGTFWLSDTPEAVASKTWGNRTTRVCTWARLVDRSSGRAFHIFNVHLDHQSQRSREKSVELVVRRMAGRRYSDPAFLLGDFNAGESNPAVRYVKGEIDRASDDPAAPTSPRWVDTFRVAQPATTGVGTFHAFTGRREGEKIDFIFAPPWVRVLRADIERPSHEGRHVSDHFPVTATVALPVVRES